MNQERVVKAGLLGLGTVGSGVYKLVECQKDEMAMKAGAGLKIQKILVHNMNKKREGVDQSLLTDKWEDIMNDDEIEIVIEVMGGIEPAYTFVKRCLQAGKSVATSNKALVAKHGAELLSIAAEHNINFLFEASVGGGIPIIRPLNSSLTADEIEEITGILNGTTNYMLTKMSREGLNYGDVLKEAQAKGYAELHPEADVEGWDACRKIAILSSLAFGNYVDYKDIYTEGITKITATDIKYAQAIGTSIKLLAVSKKTEKGTYAMVSPVMIDSSNSLYSVNDVFNAVSVHGNMLGDAMFYGKGAGKLPTASAVVADVVEAAKNLDKTVMGDGWDSKKLELMPLDEVPGRFFVRIKGSTASVLATVEAAFGEVDPVTIPSLEDEFAFITGEMTEAGYREKAAKVEGIISMIRARF